MRQKKTRRWVWAAGVAVMGGLPFACVSVENTGGLGDCANPIDGIVCPSAGSMGASGSGGASGDSGGGTGGTSGTSTMGMGGGGTGGTGGSGCVGDASCDVASGSLCVGGTCTKAIGACDAKALVVLDEGRDVGADANLQNACYFRTLDGARAALTVGTERLALYAEVATSAEVLVFDGATALEGYPADASKSVALGLPVTAGTTQVTFRVGGSLRGVALDGGGVATGIRVEGGTLAIGGTPTSLNNMALGLELVGTAAATVMGTVAAPVRLSGNQRGALIPSGAMLTMQGDGMADALVVEGTNGGAAMLFEAATGAGALSTLKGIIFRNNVGLSNGVGAVEVRKGRLLTVDGCAFEHNRRSLTLNGESTSDPDAFLGVTLIKNDFTSALPIDSGTGAIICGSDLGAGDTKLNLSVDNTFPGVATCAELGTDSQFNCDLGQRVAHSAPNLLDLKLTCVGGT